MSWAIMFSDKIKRILVTGGAGAIGSQLAAKLVNQGYFVVVVDDESSGSPMLVPPKAKYIKGSIEDSAVLEACFQNKIDAVIHCAALFANQNSVDHPERDLSVNGMATIRLLQFSQKEKVQKFVFTSSSCVYGRSENMIETNTSFNPETPYAITKLLGEQYCNFWSHLHKLNCVIVRIFNNYGPGELPGLYRNVIPNFFELAMAGQPLIITGTGNETRDFCFVEDTADGILLGLFKDTERGEIFNIGSGKETTILRVANLINEITKNKAGILFQGSRPWDQVTRRLAIIDKAKTKLGYRPSTDLRDGIVKTYQWMLSFQHQTKN